MITLTRNAESYNYELDLYKAEAAKTVKSVVGNARLNYITDLPGQDAIYQAKENEATAYLAATSPTLTDYPLLNAETGITAPTATELANLWITMAQQWRSVAAQLEAARMTANASVNLATTVAEVDAALAVLNDAIANLA
jgi:plasmid maintenance system antidote protein VapI